MPEQPLEQILREGLEQRGCRPDNETLRRFRLYYDNLEKTNRVMNLTAITGEEDAARLHFLDCAALLKLGRHNFYVSRGADHAGTATGTNPAGGA